MSLPLVMDAEASKPRRTSPSKTSPSTSPLQVTTWAKSRLVLETLEEVKCLTSEDSGVVLEALALPTTALVKEASEVSRWEALEVVCLTSGISPKKTKPVSRRCARLSKRGCRTERALVASEASRWEASVHLTTAPAKVDLVASEAVCLTLEEEAEDEDGGMGFGGKHKYVASTKGIASKGKITINSGTVTVKTATAGAEGIEGKDGVIVNGGTVDVYSPDDAINANACIEFNGGTVIARSKGNDAVDSNPKGGFFMPLGGNNNQEDADPAIVITGGTVYAWSQAGSPEEGLDCDFAPLVIEGGTIFTVGGGMGEMPSVPTNYTSKQPSVLLIGINIQKEEPIYLYDSKNKLLETITIPFALRRSASLVSSPFFEMGETYTVKTKDYEKTFTLNENFTAVR